MIEAISLRQIRAVIAVCEERSFTRAAARENATQSGISQHIAAVERALGVALFERSTAAAVGVAPAVERSNSATPTAAGTRYYRRCVDAVGALEAAGEEMRTLAGRVSGPLRVGLMPTFTRAALAPALKDYVRQHPDVTLRIVEGYSGMLTDMVLAEELDFAVVPGFEGRTGLKSRLLARDREMLLSGKARGLKPLKAVRLANFSPLKLVMPGLQNVRRRNLDTYFQTNGITVGELIEMDAMTGTLEFVAASDWVTVLPSLICVNDIAAGNIIVSPIDPPLHAEFIVIEPARRVLSVQARLFLERLEAEVARIRGVWRKKLKGRG